MLTHIHPSRVWFACRTSSQIEGTDDPSSVSGPVPEPPSAQSPFARVGCYPQRRGVTHPVRGRYPSFIAHTDSCVRPKSSLPISISLYGRSLQVVVRPLLEDGPSRRYLHGLCKGAWTHAPPRSCRSIRLVALALGSGDSIVGRRPHLSLEKFGTRNVPCNATSTGGVFRGCSHSLMFRLPHSLGSPVAPTAVTSTGLPSRLRHAMYMWLPALKHSRFYMNCDIATYPKRTN
jgi:hypothetical protein